MRIYGSLNRKFTEFQLRKCKVHKLNLIYSYLLYFINALACNFIQLMHFMCNFLVGYLRSIKKRRFLNGFVIQLIGLLLHKLKNCVRNGNINPNSHQ